MPHACGTFRRNTRRHRPTAATQALRPSNATLSTRKSTGVVDRGQQASITSRTDRCDTHLLEQCQIVLDVPIVGDAAVLDPDKIGRDEVDRLSPRRSILSKIGHRVVSSVGRARRLRSSFGLILVRPSIVPTSCSASPYLYR